MTQIKIIKYELESLKVEGLNVATCSVGVKNVHTNYDGLAVVFWLHDEKN